MDQFRQSLCSNLIQQASRRNPLTNQVWMVRLRLLRGVGYYHRTQCRRPGALLPLLFCVGPSCVRDPLALIPFGVGQLAANVSEERLRLAFPVADNAAHAIGKQLDRAVTLAAAVVCNVGAVPLPISRHVRIHNAHFLARQGQRRAYVALKHQWCVHAPPRCG
ncbi:hypothetical protein D9M70_453350 [compost metagenome]